MFEINTASGRVMIIKQYVVSIEARSDGGAKVLVIGGTYYADEDYHYVLDLMRYDE